MTENNNNAKSVFELTQEDLDVRLLPLMNDAIAKRYDKGLPVSYRDDRCPTAWHFIHEYADGKKFLVQLDEATRDFGTIQQLD